VLPIETHAQPANTASGKLVLPIETHAQPPCRALAAPAALGRASSPAPGSTRAAPRERAPPRPASRARPPPSRWRRAGRYARLTLTLPYARRYASFYLTRNSLAYVAPAMLKDPGMGMDLAKVGGLTSILPVAYGFSKFLSGVLGARTSPVMLLAGARRRALPPALPVTMHSRDCAHSSPHKRSDRPRWPCGCFLARLITGLPVWVSCQARTHHRGARQQPRRRHCMWGDLSTVVWAARRPGSHGVGQHPLWRVYRLPDAARLLGAQRPAAGARDLRASRWRSEPVQCIPNMFSLWRPWQVL